MQMKHIFSIAFLWSLSITTSIGQNAEYVDGQALIMTQSIDIQPEEILSINKSLSQKVSIVKRVSKPLSIWLLSFDHKKISANKLIAELKDHRLIKEAQVNHIIKNRATLPNDTDISQQWQYVNNGSNGGVVDADLDADEAWDITTGGVTTEGDTIVVCVIDDGIDLNHSDWGNNIWVNHGEISGNGLDDDGNGYVDDHMGWNTNNSSNDISGGSWGGGHGTPVSGIVGAKGNNGNGVSGVNWDVKIMMVVGGGNEAEAIAAYSYPLAMRKLYEQSGGTKGAYVVSTNASWGVDYGQASSAPLWCAMYDSLGKYGILSAGATANINLNIDVHGDLPTSCPSDFLISVTNMNRSDVKVTGAGYGATTIDIGAFGEAAYTIEKGGSYDGFGGTSGASPHVAGAVALMHSVPCAQFAQLAKSNPPLGAMLIKDYILAGVDSNSSLASITTSQGRLNLNKALLEIQNRCGTFDCIEPMLLKADTLKATQAWLSWQAGAMVSSYEIDMREQGTSTWITQSSATNNIHLTGLSACLSYEIRVRAACTLGVYSLYSDTLMLNTAGCCDVPTNIDINDITITSALVSWDSIYASGTTYNVSYEVDNSSNWLTLGNITNTFVTLTNLDSCQKYNVKVKANCSGTQTAFSSPESFNTEGCEACKNEAYCESKGGDSSDEWINSVAFNTINNTSGNDNGYGNHTNHNTVLNLGQAYDISLEPGFSGNSFDEYFSVWIDYNADGDFDDSGENILTHGPVTSLFTQNITISSAATLGVTRMRISMSFNTLPSSSCGTLSYGEVEDYCLYLQEVPESVEELFNNKPLVYPNPFSKRINIKGELENTDIHMTDILGRLVFSTNINTKKALSINTENFPSGVYHINIKNKKGQILNSLSLIKIQ
jgi:hypothetical protein